MSDNATSTPQPATTEPTTEQLNKEAGRVLSWLNKTGCLGFGKLNQATTDIQQGKHRK